MSSGRPVQGRGTPGGLGQGKVWLIGAGAGAPDLLTLRAARLLAEADVVFHDALVHPHTLALAARAQHVPVGKRCDRPSTAQRFINERLVEAARRYPVVIRLKGGDPMLFGRAQEEIEALQAAGIEFEVVPGISAAFAASADLAQSLTVRGLSRSVVLLTPRVGEGQAGHDWARPAAAADTVVLYMAGRQAVSIAAGLIAAGLARSRPVVLVESASLASRRIVAGRLGRLVQMTQQIGDGPLLMLIGEVYEDLAASADAAARPVRVRPAPGQVCTHGRPALRQPPRLPRCSCSSMSPSNPSRML